MQQSTGTHGSGLYEPGGSETQDVGMLMRQQPGYRLVFPNLVEGQTPMRHNYIFNTEDILVYAGELDTPVPRPTHLTCLTQLGYHYTPTSYGTFESIPMPSMLPTMSELGLCSHGHLDRSSLPHSSTYMNDSETHAKVDLDDETNDRQDPKPDDPTQHVLGVNQVQTIGMYVCQSNNINIYIYACSICSQCSL